MKAIAEHHGCSPYACYRCGVIARVEKAHVIDRVWGGLDDVQNMVPLCFRCHSEQPVFAPGEEQRALIWMSTTTDMEYLLAATTYTFLHTSEEDGDPTERVLAAGLFVGTTAPVARR